jgi:hypothetical protein
MIDQIPPDPEHAAAIERGRQRLISWTRDGTLLSPDDFAIRRGVPLSRLIEEERAGVLFALYVEGRRWYPAELLKLPEAAAVAVCRLLRRDSVRVTIFVIRRHGFLKNRTLAEAIRDDEVSLESVVSLARMWKDE